MYGDDRMYRKNRRKVKRMEERENVSSNLDKRSQID